MNKNPFIALGVGVLAIVIIAGLWFAFRPPPPQAECSFTGWQQTFGISLEAKVEQLDALKTSIGLTESQVRAFDTLMKDYALKYDMVCQEARATPPKITSEEYACVRRNMERTLDDLRAFSQAVDAAKAVAEAPAQREIILKALENLDAARRAGYKMNCASAVGVAPKTLTFAGLTPERSIQIANRGNNDLTFAVEDYPQGFEPKPSSGRVARGDTVAVAVFRTILPPPNTRPLTLHVRTNFNDDVEIEISVDAQNTAMWSTLGKQAAALSGGAVPTIDNALRAITSTIEPSSNISEADKYVLASNALFAHNAIGQAWTALDTASKLNPAAETDASVKNLRALISARKSSPDEALKYFAVAQDSEKTRRNTDRIHAEPKEKPMMGVETIQR